ncbi:RibD family protein [Hyphomicrobium methylovorum]|uniref:RibD family protein n=1 Tax=Hyphomicrobium methylovorum TaxID=84 RepID=UPI001FE7AE73|nr:RibD family protein [Hyphomicrobium methylovorum]
MGKTHRTEGDGRGEHHAPLALVNDPIFGPIVGADPQKPFVIAQLGQSLDGRIATASGESRWINGASALDHLHRLRAHVDAVVVGATTIVADDPRLTVRRVAGRQPARVVIDPTGRLAAPAQWLADDGARRIVVRGGEGPVATGAEAVAVPFAGGRLDPAAIAMALFHLGLKKILIEGGARTLSHFIDAGAVDRVHMLIAPIIIGSGVQGLSLPPISTLDKALRPTTKVHVLDDGDVLFDCDLRHQRRG